MDFKNFEYGIDKIPCLYYEHILFFARLEKKFFADLKKLALAQGYYEKYDKGSVNGFLEQYAEHKAILAEKYLYYIDPRYQPRKKKYRNYAEKMLAAIRHKQLFNIQLQWRAEKIKIKGVKTTYDLDFWEFYIRACPFLPVISKKEIKVMKQFLLTSDISATYLIACMPYANYHHFLYGYAEPEDDDDFEDFYDNEQYMVDALHAWSVYYDENMGTSSLIQLPDIHKEKEQYYRKIAKQKLNEDQEKKEAKKRATAVKEKPFMMMGQKDIFDFSRKFETDKYFRELFRLHLQNDIPDGYPPDYIEDDDEFFLKQAIKTLQESEEPITMPGGLPWRKAIMTCEARYINPIVVSHLDDVYNDYLNFIKSGKYKGVNYKMVREKYNTNPPRLQAEYEILLGRKLCGEPQNFNF